MNNNGRKISSKYIVVLIFTALFFSVTFNSPANYSSAIHFGNSLAFGNDTTGPGSARLKDSIAKLRDSIARENSRTYRSRNDSLPKPGGRNDSASLAADTLGVVSVILSRDSLEALRPRND